MRFRASADRQGQRIASSVAAAGARHVRLSDSGEWVDFTVGAAALRLDWSPSDGAYVMTRRAADGSMRPAGQLYDLDAAVALAMLAG